MPQKVNPVLSVLIRRAALTAPAYASLLHLAAADTGDERPAGAWHVEWEPLGLIARHNLTAGRQTSEVLAGIRVQADRMAATLDAHRLDVSAEYRLDIAVAGRAGGPVPWAGSRGRRRPYRRRSRPGPHLARRGATVTFRTLTLVPLTAPAPGRPLLLLGPSLGTGTEALRGRCAQLLADEFEIVGLELPGRGQGGAATAAFRVEDLADTVMAAVDEQLTGRAGRAFFYAGDSIGGPSGSLY